MKISINLLHFSPVGFLYTNNVCMFKNKTKNTAMHDTLQELHLDGNNLTDFSFADTLSSCPSFHTLR